mgnify:FL=1
MGCKKVIVQVITSSITYKFNKKNGERLECYYNNDNNKVDGKYYYINDKLNGVYIEYRSPEYSYIYDNYKKGTIHEKYYYIDGKRNGEIIEYHDNGKIRKKYYYINGKINGEAVWYHENGNIQMKYYLIDDEINGFGIQYTYKRKLDQDTVIQTTHYYTDSKKIQTKKIAKNCHR